MVAGQLDEPVLFQNFRRIQKLPLVDNNRSSILRGFFDEVLNQRKLGLLSDYVSQNYAAHVTPYVGVGIAPEYSSSEKVIIQTVVPGGRPTAS